MNRIGLFLLLTILVVFMSSCKKKDEVDVVKKLTVIKSPSLSVNLLTKYQFDKNDSLFIFELLPTSSPSGNISLMSVKNGKSEKLQDLRFQKMKKTGTLAIKVTKTGIDLGYDLDCATISFNKQQITIPKNAEYLGSGYSSIESFGGVCWHIAFSIGDRPSELTTGSDTDIFIESSEKNPAIIFYILSITIDETSNNEDSSNSDPAVAKPK